MTRPRKRRIALIAALLTVVTIAAWTWLPRTEPKKFYAYLERHSWLTQVVRVGALLTGKLDEFDQGIAQARVDRIIPIIFSAVVVQSAAETLQPPVEEDTPDAQNP